VAGLSAEFESELPSPSSVLRRPPSVDDDDELGTVLRYARRVAGTDIAEPVAVDADARWAWWFGPEGELRRRISEDRDTVLVIHGPRGCGKSTLSLRIARSLDNSITAATLARHVAFDVPSFLSLHRAARESFVWLDEAVAGAASFDWSSPDGRELVRTLSTGRWRHNTAGLLIPQLEELMKATRGRIADTLISCSNRPKGRAWVRERNRDLWRPLKADDMGLRTDRRYNPVEWDPFEEDDPLYAEYIRLKKVSDDRRSRTAEAGLRAERRYRMGQAARRLGISPRHLLRLITRGDATVAGVTPGGERLVSESELERLESEYPKRRRGPRGRNGRFARRARHGEED
jgi:hypothetical protein